MQIEQILINFDPKERDEAADLIKLLDAARHPENPRPDLIPPTSQTDPAEAKRIILDNKYKELSQILDIFD